MVMADAIEWMVRKDGVCPIMYFLDNFLLIEAQDGQECA